MIRPAGIDDISDLIRLQSAAEAEGAVWGYVAEAHEVWATRDLSWTAVASDGRHALGFVHAAPRPYAGECVFPGDSAILEIVDLIIDADARSQGLGFELVAWVRDRACEDGYTHLRVYSASKRFDDVVRFYRSCGFTPWYLEMTQQLDVRATRAGIEVRPAVPEDRAGYLEVDAQAVATLRRTYRPNLAALEHRDSLKQLLERLVAVSEGRIVGTVQWYVQADCVRLLGLGVKPEWRRHGVARRLIAALSAIAVENGLSRLSLSTVRETGNVEIFVRLGFSVVSVGPDAYSESERFPSLTNVEMECSLG